MKKSYIFPIVFGLSGLAILISLGVWQVNRLEWKNGILAELDKKIAANPTELSKNVSKKEDQYRAVSVSGRFSESEIHVLGSVRFLGPGFRVVAPLELENGRIILVDRGFVKEVEKNQKRYLGPIQITGNLLWPNETDAFTPQPDFEKNMWFSRNLEEMSKYLNTEEVLIVATESDPIVENLKPQPIGLNIPNNHLSYALTWFSLSLVWLGMTIYLLWRINKQQL